MFETSVVRVRAVAAQRRFGVLAASVGAHSIVAIGIVLPSVSSVHFPAQAPSEIRLFRPVGSVQVPPPLGTPNANPKTGDSSDHAGTSKQWATDDCP